MDEGVKAFLDKITDMLKQVISKMVSGRYFLTICAGIVFIYTSLKDKIPPEAVAGIITMVFTLYFSKQQNGGQ